MSPSLVRTRVCVCIVCFLIVSRVVQLNRLLHLFDSASKKVGIAHPECLAIVPQSRSVPVSSCIAFTPSNGKLARDVMRGVDKVDESTINDDADEKGKSYQICWRSRGRSSRVMNQRRKDD
jgi:hypothetical protein